MNIQVNYKDCGEELKRILRLRGSPVAVAFASDESQIPAGIPRLEGAIRHCTMISLARHEGKIFYATAAEHECNGGGWALGLKNITPTLANGEFYYRLGKFASPSSSKRTLSRISHLPPSSTFATLYSPLEKLPFTPHVIIIIASPRAMLKSAQAALFLLGGRITAEFSGIQSVCSDACAQVLLSGEPNYSLGCDGSRRYSGIEEGEMVLGLPAECLPNFVDALAKVTEARGSQ